MKNAVVELVDFVGDPSEGSFSCRVVPRQEHFRFLLSERGMGNLAGSSEFGESAVSYTYLGIMSPAGGVLFSTALPLPEFARFSITGDRLEVESPVPVSIEFDPEGLTPLLRAYGERYRRGPRREPTFGWNSWDNCASSLCEEDVLANLRYIAGSSLLKDKLSYVILDDGWQTTWGLWEANSKFPRGMAAVARDIHAAGYKAGIWLAPLMVQSTAPLYQRKPQCFLKDGEGHPYNVLPGRYALDVTVPESREFLRETFAKVREWGYDYVKLDFLITQTRCLELGAVAADETASTAWHVAETLRIANEELGPEVRVLGCNYPFELLGEGVAEARLTSDIATFRENVEFCYKAFAARFFMHGNWMMVDPDFAVVRVPGVTWTDGEMPYHVTPAWELDEAPGGWRKGDFWTEEEMKMALALVILSGGSVVLGDHLPQLNARGLEYLRVALEYGGREAAWPLDLNGVRSLPCVFRSGELLAFMNPYNRPLTLEMPAGVNPGEEIFTGEVAAGSAVELMPRSCKVYTIR